MLLGNLGRCAWLQLNVFDWVLLGSPRGKASLLVSMAELRGADDAWYSLKEYDRVVAQESTPRVMEQHRLAEDAGGVPEVAALLLRAEWMDG